MEWFEKIKADIDYIEVDANKYAENRYGLGGNHSPEPKTRKEFWEDYQNCEFSTIINKYA